MNAKHDALSSASRKKRAMSKTKMQAATKTSRMVDAKPPAPKPSANSTSRKKAEASTLELKKRTPSKATAQVPSAHKARLDHSATSTESTTTPPLEEAPARVEPTPRPPAATADVTPSSPASIASDGAMAEGPKPTSESRLPPPGTMLQRRDRRGQVLSECVVVEGGVRYAGTVYASLSAAALAAARDRGRTSTSINGWGYWGLTKPARTEGGRRDPLTLLDAAWARFRERVNQLLGEDVPEEARGRVLAQVKEHAKTLERLGGSAA